MNQKKLKLPKNYFELIAENQDNIHSAQKDQYGFELDTELNVFYETKEEILSAYLQYPTLTEKPKSDFLKPYFEIWLRGYHFVFNGNKLILF